MAHHFGMAALHGPGSRNSPQRGRSRCRAPLICSSNSKNDSAASKKQPVAAVCTMNISCDKLCSACLSRLHLRCSHLAAAPASHLHDAATAASRRLMLPRVLHRLSGSTGPRGPGLCSACDLGLAPCVGAACGGVLRLPVSEADRQRSDHIIDSIHVCLGWSQGAHDAAARLKPCSVCACC